MEFTSLLSYTIVAVICLSSCVDAYIQCGFFTCYGDDAYCCTLDTGARGCCYSFEVVNMWWFWIIWVIIFFIALAIGMACWRRRRMQYRYVVMSNSEYPSYGTVVHTSATTQNYQGALPNAPPPPSYPHLGNAAPPSGYAAPPPAYAAPQKPPPYS
ncbi:WW domain binding protein 1-like [Physella acuta]|uniref:WW domain binding protein 1-like n=1 Tax=Physella acuta TaxID=109671 RepID=UPI0027DE8E07|nr:WW domain binding protein 1-like [Physella acuta]